MFYENLKRSPARHSPVRGLPARRSPGSSARFFGLALLCLALSIPLSGCSTSRADSDRSPRPEQTPAIAPTRPSNFAFEGQGQSLPITAQAKLGGQLIDLEVARTPDQQAMGLMHRPPLPDNRGMLFPFQPARPVSFWMKNVPVALDMVFLHRGKVVMVAPQVPPCTTPSCPTYGPPGLVDAVIELRAGRAAELGLQPKDRVEIIEKP